MAGGDQKAWSRGQLKVVFVTDRFGSFAKISERRTHVRFDPQPKEKCIDECAFFCNREHGLSFD
jgi:hypothetical protein